MVQGLSMRTCLDPRTYIELTAINPAFPSRDERKSQQSPKACLPAKLSNKTLDLKQGERQVLTPEITL